MQVTVEIPDEFASDLFAAGEDPARKLLEASVAQAYREGKLTTPELQLALGFASRFEVDPFLSRFGINDYGLDDYRHDLQTLKRMRLQSA